MKGKMTNLLESDPRTNEAVTEVEARRAIINRLLQELQANPEATRQDSSLVDPLGPLVESVNGGTAVFTAEDRKLLADIGATPEDLEHFPLSMGEDTVEVSDEPESGGNQFSPQN